MSQDYGGSTQGSAGEAAPQFTAGLGGLVARGALGDEVARFLPQIRKRRARGEELILDALLGRESRNWGCVPVFALGLPAETGGQHQALFDLFVKGPQERACLHGASISVTGEVAGREEA